MIQDEFDQVVFTKVVHLDVVLDEVQRVGFVWFEKSLNTEAQSRHQAKNGSFDH